MSTENDQSMPCIYCINGEMVKNDELYFCELCGHIISFCNECEEIMVLRWFQYLHDYPVYTRKEYVGTLTDNYTFFIPQNTMFDWYCKTCNQLQRNEWA